MPLYVRVVIVAVIVLVLRQLLPKGHAKTIVPITFFVGWFAYAAIYPEVIAAIQGYRYQRNNWLATSCKEFTDRVAHPLDGPVQIEGFLDATNYDELLTKRAHEKIDELREGTGGGAVAMDMGQVHQHVIAAVIRGGTFDHNAAKVLTQHGFSFVEFEMYRLERGNTRTQVR